MLLQESNFNRAAAMQGAHYILHLI